MPEIPKTQDKQKEKASNNSHNDEAISDKDEKLRKYYYDDAHGYETFKDEDADED
jgi:hypothetical protein